MKCPVDNDNVSKENMWTHCDHKEVQLVDTVNNVVPLGNFNKNPSTLDVSGETNSPTEN